MKKARAEEETLDRRTQLVPSLGIRQTKVDSWPRLIELLLPSPARASHEWSQPEASVIGLHDVVPLGVSRADRRVEKSGMGVHGDCRYMRPVSDKDGRGSKAS